MDALGSPPRFTLTRVPRVTFVVRWEYDGHRIQYDPSTDTTEEIPERREQVKSFYSKSAAYKWLARRMIFKRRDKFATGPKGNDGRASCELCGPSIDRETGEPIGLCRYHETQDFQRLVSRLARWLSWRDSVVEGKAA